MKHKTEVLLSIIFGIAAFYVLLRVSIRGHIYPAAMVGSAHVAGLSKNDAEAMLNEVIAKNGIALSYNGYVWQVPNTIFTYNVEESVNQAYRIGRRFDYQDWVALVLRQKKVVPAQVNVDVSSLNAWLDTITPSVEITPTVASVVTTKDGITVINGSDGSLLNREQLIKDITVAAEQLSSNKIEVTTRSVSNRLNENEMAQLKDKATKLLTANLIIEVDDNKTTLTGDKLIALLNTEPNEQKNWDQTAIESYLSGLSETYNRESENARFEVLDGKVKEFAPSKDGLKLDEGTTSQLLIAALDQLIGGTKVDKVVAKVNKTPPRVSNADVNRLGIETRIGRGESNYGHSIPGRIHNVGLTASRITSALVPPGEEFSFNKAVGEISGATGYAPAYVIKNGRTELGDGGGVCQVSTTVFRAALAAGLPITERWAHAYRVGYYEQGYEPGIDATIYSPSKDFKFLNDTPGYILVQAIDDPKTLHLIIDIYGTNDGRKSEVSKVKVWGNTPPPPDLYQDDPTLALGKIKQVDWSAWGAKTTFDYKVTRNGQTIFEKSFPSTYKAWQNVYLRGTKVQ